MQQHLFSHIRNEHGHIVATLALNKDFQLGVVVRNPKDKTISRKRALKISAIRSDKQSYIKLPDRWITPYTFVKDRENSTVPFTDLLAIPLSSLIDEEYHRLVERGKKYFK